MNIRQDTNTVCRHQYNFKKMIYFNVIASVSVKHDTRRILNMSLIKSICVTKLQLKSHKQIYKVIEVTYVHKKEKEVSGNRLSLIPYLLVTSKEKPSLIFYKNITIIIISKNHPLIVTILLPPF
jgi:hypothetical protein